MKAGAGPSMARKQQRKADVERKTKETSIKLSVNLDGKGESRIDTGVPFLDHMLNLVAKHGFFDLKVEARGDVDIDDHHTVEDIGICLGKAFTKALGDKEGIERFGFASVPLDESLAQVTADISGRSCLVMKARLGRHRVGTFDPELVMDFFQAFVSNAGVTLHIHVPYGRNAHHKIECIFKAFARATAQAVSINTRRSGLPTTKGLL